MVTIYLLHVIINKPKFTNYIIVIPGKPLNYKVIHVQCTCTFN